MSLERAPLPSDVMALRGDQQAWKELQGIGAVTYKECLSSTSPLTDLLISYHRTPSKRR